MTNFYSFSRKLHRYLVLIMLALLLVMAGTGAMMRYPRWFGWLPSWFTLSKARYLHGNVSTYFTIVVVIMALTGAYMYFYPLWQEHKQKRNLNKTEPSSQA